MLARQGNKRAMDRFMADNMGFVINLAKEYQNQGVDFDDLVSEGNLAMFNCIHKWDAEKTHSFVKYAVYDIRKAMQQAVDREGRVVRVPEGENSSVRSMDAPLRPGHTRSLGETMPQRDHQSPTESTDENIVTLDLLERVETLNEREHNVIARYYGLDTPHQSMAEIAESMGLKRERVRQIRKKAERKLRKARIK